MRSFFAGDVNLRLPSDEDMLDVVFSERAIRGDDRKIRDARLSDQEPVERVELMQGQGEKLEAVFRKNPSLVGSGEFLAGDFGDYLTVTDNLRILQALLVDRRKTR